MGINQTIVAYVQPGDLVSLLLFRNVFIAIIPSFATGLLPGLIVKFGSNIKPDIRYFLAGASASLANSFLVILLTSLFYLNNSRVLISALGKIDSSNSLFIILTLALGFSGLVELIFTAIANWAITKPLKIIIYKNC